MLCKTRVKATLTNTLAYLRKFKFPRACIIKRITAVIYGFRNKLECLSLASLYIQV